jgi:PAS domain S-box-containing protein
VVQDPDWPPVEFAEGEGTPTGMTRDYLTLIEQRLGQKFEPVLHLSWKEAYDRLKRGEIDMTTTVAETPERLQFWAFTKPYMNIPIVIAAQTSVTYIDGLHELEGKRVAVVDGYAVNDWIPRDFPKLRLIKVKTSLEGLQQLQRGEVDAFIDSLLTIEYYQSRRKDLNLKIAGGTPYVNAQRMAVRKDWAPFAGILQQALDSITETERNEIFRRWLPIRYEHGFDYTRLWQALAIFALILLSLGLWNRKLRREIAGRKQAQAALNESRSRVELFILHAPAAIAMFDREMRYLVASHRWCEDYSLGPRSIIGRSHYDIFPEIGERWKEAHRRALSGEVIKAEMDRFDRADGTVQWLRWEVRPWQAADGSIGGIVVVSEDFTRYHTAQMEVQRLNANLEQRVSERTAELMAANNELDSFAYAVSHDLRAPLRAMSGFSHALIEDYGPDLDEQAKTYLEQIIVASRRMEQLIEGILALSRTTRMELTREPIDISALATRQLGELARGDMSRTVDWHVDPALTTIGDTRTVEALMSNLLGNAWKYTSHTEGASIRVHAGARGLADEICVTDNGAGFDMDHATQLFRPFRRLHRQDEFPGIGIGLATTQRIVHRHGGAICATGLPNGGATFCFTLSPHSHGVAHES